MRGTFSQILLWQRHQSTILKIICAVLIFKHIFNSCLTVCRYFILYSAFCAYIFLLSQHISGRSAPCYFYNTGVYPPTAYSNHLNCRFLNSFQDFIIQCCMTVQVYLYFICNRRCTVWYFTPVTMFVVIKYTEKSLFLTLCCSIRQH